MTSRTSRSVLIIAVALLFSADLSHGQLLQLASPSVTLTEDFNSLGSVATAPLPLGWKFNTGTAFESGSMSTQFAAGTTGSGALTSSSAGFYNFADGDNLTSTDRAVGMLASSTRPINRSSLFLGLENRSGALINELQINYDVEKYRSGTIAYDMHFFYGFDGVIWNQVPEATVHYNSDANTSVVHPAATTSRSVLLSSLAVPDLGTLYFRWHYSATAPTNSQALGIDNVHLQLGSALPASLTWAGAEGAVWDDQSPNWKNSSGQSLAWSDGAGEAIFAGGSGATSNVTLVSPRIVGCLIFDAPTTSYALSGASIQIQAPGGIGIDARSDAQVQSAVLVNNSQTWKSDSSVHISGPLTIAPGRTLTKTGSGSLRLSGVQNPGDEAALKVAAGTLRLASNVNSLHLSIVGNANGTDSQVILEADQDLSSLTLSVADAGRQGLNLSSPLDSGAYRSLRIHSVELESIKSSIHQLINHARANPGDGIYDSGAGSHNATLGVAVFGGYVLVRPTRLGDLNLDGVVTIADFIDLASHFGGSGVTWQEGDVNGDNAVTISDFIDLAANFGGTYSGEALPVAPADRQALEAFAAAHAIALPEPLAGSAAILAALALLRRCRLQSLK